MNQECEFEGCERPQFLKKNNLCRGHYQQQQRGKPLTPIRKKLRLVHPPGLRICTTCFVGKSLSEYYFRTDDTPVSECKPCRIKRTVRNQRAKNQAKKGA